MLNSFAKGSFKDLQEKIDTLRDFEELPLIHVNEKNANDVFLYLISKDFNFFFEYQISQMKILKALLAPFKVSDNVYVFKTGDVCACVLKELKHNSSLREIKSKLPRDNVEKFIETIIETPFLIKLEYKKYYFCTDFIYDSIRIYYGLQLNPYLIYSSPATLAEKLRVKTASAEGFKNMIKEFNAINKEFEKSTHLFKK